MAKLRLELCTSHANMRATATRVSRTSANAFNEAHSAKSFAIAMQIVPIDFPAAIARATATPTVALVKLPAESVIPIFAKCVAPVSDP